MKWSRPTLAVLIILAGFFLAGFKKPLQKHDESSKKKHSSLQQNNPKPLDLTLPSRNVSFQDPSEVLTVVHSKYAGSNTENKLNNTKSRPLELKGNVIMSQEPEAEKAKSADGAGIIINLRH
ncbi:MAG: hypothetical protein IPN42_12945 [Methylococcaceae bacterium]|nr:hypothetical protein [Methylococcaceae bacterium]